MQIKELVAIAACSAWLACAAVDLPPETVLVKKGDMQVTAGDLYASLAQLSEDQRFSYRTDVLRITSTVSSLFLARTLANEARGAGIDREPEVLARLKLAEEQLLTQIYLERFEKSIKTPDFEPRALEVYKADPARFTQPARVQFKRILVSFQGRTHEEAKRRAEEARQKLLAGENFTRTASEYTNDPTFKANNGIIGPAPYADFVKEIAESARTSPIGQVSDLIESGEGYHVIVVEQRLPESVIPFEKAKKALIEADQNKFRRTVINKKLADITNSKEITLYTDELASLKTEVDRDHLRRMHEEEAALQAEGVEEARRKEKKPEAAKKGG